MSKKKEKNLRRFIVLYIAGSLALGGVAYAEESGDYIANGKPIVVEDGQIYGDGDIVGGAFNGSVDLSSVTLNGGTMQTILGGGSAENGTAHVGEAVVTINGGKVEMVQGGGDADWKNATSTVDRTTININGGQVGGYVDEIGYGIIGGGMAWVDTDDIANAKNTSTVGEVTINIKDGDIRDNVYGGGLAGTYNYEDSMADIGGSKASTAVDKVTIAISGDTVIGYDTDKQDAAVYAGGAAAGKGSESSVNTATITISGNAKILEVNGGGDATGGTSVVGTSNIVISENANVGTVVGGGYSEEGGIVETKNVNVQIKGGAVGNLLGGGSASGSESSSTVGTATINIEDSKITGRIYAGGSIEQGGNGTVGASTIHIVNSTVNKINGNAYINKMQSENANAKMGEVAIHLKNSVTDRIILGGESVGRTSLDEVKKASLFVDKDSQVKGNIFGGGHAVNESDTGNVHDFGGSSKVTESNVFVDGNVQYIYGGGRVDGNGTTAVEKSLISITDNAVVDESILGGGRVESIPDHTATGTSTVEKSEIRIAGGVIKGDVYAGGEGIGSRVEQSQVNISGGTVNGNVSGQGIKGATVGKSELNFTAGKGAMIDGTVSGFGAVTVQDGAKATLTGKKVSEGAAAIQADNLTIQEGGKLTIEKNMTFTLGNTGVPATLSLRSARIVDGTLNLAGELEIASGANLTLENTNLVSQSSGMVTVNVKDDLSAAGKLTLNNSALANERINLNIGLSLEKVKNLSGDELNKIIEEALTKDLAEKTTIANGMNAEYQYIKDTNGKITGVSANTSYLGFYTGARQASAYITQNMIENIHDRNASLRSGAKANDFWVNIRGGSTDVDNQYGKAEVKHQYYQLGYDWDISSGNEKAVVGVYFSKIYGDITQYNIKSDIDNAYDFGVYGMKEFNNGTYVGLIGRYGEMKNSARVDTRTVDWKDKSYALSAEFGKRIEQKSGWMMEPYLQLNYTHLSDASFNTGNTDVTMAGSNLMDSRVGIRFIQQEKDRPQNNIYGGVAYVKGLSGDFTMKSRSGMDLVESDNDTSAFEVSVGMNRQISICSSVNLNAKKEFGDYDGWSLQGMVNVIF